MTNEYFYYWLDNFKSKLDITEVDLKKFMVMLMEEYQFTLKELNHKMFSLLCFHLSFWHNHNDIFNCFRKLYSEMEKEYAGLNQIIEDKRKLINSIEECHKEALNFYQGIYAIKNVVNNKFYIGKSENIKVRWLSHKSLLRNNKHHCLKLQDDWNKYGETAFEFLRLEMVDDIKIIFKRERHWYLKYREKYKTYNEVKTGVDSPFDIIEGLTQRIKELESMLAANGI